jgi:uncharacterized protein YegL
MDYDGFSGSNEVPTIPAIVEVNCEERTPCSLLLDISGSMDGARIAQLNQGLRDFEAAIKADPLTAARVSINIVTIGGAGPSQVNIAQDWVDGTDFRAPPPFTAGGPTPMGGGMDLVLDEQRSFTKSVLANGGTHKCPWVFAITDGSPTDDYAAAAARCAAAVGAGKLLFWPLATDGADHRALLQFAGPEGQVYDVAGADLRLMFRWLSVSLASASQANAGEEVQIQAPGRMISVRV